MNLLKRFAYYFAGLVVGTLILLFILNKKEASCDYSPNSRVLKNIRTKKQAISPEVLTILSKNKIDTSFISKTLGNGDVLFRESQTKLDSCNIYIIRGLNEWKDWKLSVENCADTVKVFSVEPVK